MKRQRVQGSGGSRVRVAAALAVVLLAGCADLTYDATDPYVAIVYPVSWSSLARDTIEVRADAYDNHQLDRVVFFADGESIAAVAAEPYSARWYPDTTGGHSLHCVAYDANGNEAHTAPTVVTITSPGELPDTDPPFVSLVRPASWSVVSDTVRIEAIAADNRGVARIAFFLDGDSLAVLGAGPWIHFWDSRATGNGYHTIYTAAADSSGNIAYSAVITVDVQNAP